ncbi:Vesicle transport protein, SFT2-like [Phytophthora cactorum]|nr:Vesicle transport protein, SFT2-like [Phytophthora cactorum]
MSTQAAALALDTAGSLKNVAQKSNIASSLKDATQKGSAALQAKAGALSIKVPAVVKPSGSSSSLASSAADTANESDLEGGKSPSNTNQEKEGLLNELGRSVGSPSASDSTAPLAATCSAHSLKVMCMPVRRVACCIWIGAMFTTLIIAFGFPKAGPLVLFLVIIQYSAMLWYGASFIPYGRALLRKGCTKAASYATS